MAIDESLFPEVSGTADTEILFYLALTFGLEGDPADAVARTIGLVEDVGRHKGVEFPFQGTIATTDGERMWAFRYSSEGKSRSLFYSRTSRRSGARSRPRFCSRSPTIRAWSSPSPSGTFRSLDEVPEGSYGVVGKGDEQLRPFRPKAPTTSVAVGV